MISPDGARRDAPRRDPSGQARTRTHVDSVKIVRVASRRVAADRAHGVPGRETRWSPTSRRGRGAVSPREYAS